VVGVIVVVRESVEASEEMDGGTRELGQIGIRDQISGLEFSPT